MMMIIAEPKIRANSLNMGTFMGSIKMYLKSVYRTFGLVIMILLNYHSSKSHSPENSDMGTK